MTAVGKKVWVRLRSGTLDREGYIASGTVVAVHPLMPGSGGTGRDAAPEVWEIDVAGGICIRHPDQVRAVGA